MSSLCNVYFKFYMVCNVFTFLDCALFLLFSNIVNICTCGLPVASCARE